MNEHRTAEEIEAAKKVVWSNSKKVCTRCNTLVGNYVDNGMAVYCMECLAFFCNKHLDSIRNLEQQLQAETQRADKAEEMVAGLSEALVECREFNRSIALAHGLKTEENSKLGREVYDASGTILELASTFKEAFRQKLCDEIVNQIEASRKEVMEHTPCTDHIGFDNSIDIVKSVLIE